MKSIVFQELLHQGYRQTLDVDKVLFEDKADVQQLIIFQNSKFGRVMVLDGVVQTTENDEFIYHEMLVHVPVFAHGNVKKILIIGGGDGGILREALRHQSVESVTMVEIDGAVIEMCKTYFPNHSQGAFDSPRANIIIDDGCRYIENCTEKYDLIICDSTDPIGPGEVLFTSTFYQNCKNCLTEGGVMVTQNGVMYFQLDELKQTARFFKHLYRDQSFYKAAIPTYVGGDMAFGWGTDDISLRTVPLEVLQKRYVESQIQTKYYTPEIHVGAFALPKYVLDAL